MSFFELIKKPFLANKLKTQQKEQFEQMLSGLIGDTPSVGLIGDTHGPGFLWNTNKGSLATHLLGNYIGETEGGNIFGEGRMLIKSILCTL